MNRGVFPSFEVQQMVGGSTNNWLEMSSGIRPSTTTTLQYPFLLPSSTPSLFFQQQHQQQQPSFVSMAAASCNDNNNQELPESWSQLLLGGLIEGEEECSYSTQLFPAKKTEDWEEQQGFYSTTTAASVHMDAIKQEMAESTYAGYGSCAQEISHVAATCTSGWNHHQIRSTSSPRSCVTTSLSSSMLDFSSSSKPTAAEKDITNLILHLSTTGAGLSPYKKTRVQSSAQSTFKVRKEKLGDRITALHQLVSPFGKTDTASVLLEAIGYIRFLQNQIEALSSPYLGPSSSNIRSNSKHGQGERSSCIFPEDPGQLLNDPSSKRRGASNQERSTSDEEAKKDLRSRGLCLVPVSCTMHVGSDNGADYWAPAFAGGFQ